MEAAHLEDWAKHTLPSWRHSIWVGVYDPWIVVSKVGRRKAGIGGGRGECEAECHMLERKAGSVHAPMVCEGA